MEELINRLRSIDAHWEPALAQELCRAAADAIERLQQADRQAGGDAGEREKAPRRRPAAGQS